MSESIRGGVEGFLSLPIAVLGTELQTQEHGNLRHDVVRGTSASESHLPDPFELCADRRAFAHRGCSRFDCCGEEAGPRWNKDACPHQERDWSRAKKCSEYPLGQRGLRSGCSEDGMHRSPSPTGIYVIHSWVSCLRLSLSSARRRCLLYGSHPSAKS